MQSSSRAPKTTSSNVKDATKEARARQKKRESDRLCQRAARERTKARIAALEALVDGLQRQDANQQLAILFQKLVNVSKERDQLAMSLKTIEEALQKSKRPDDAFAPPSPMTESMLLTTDINTNAASPPVDLASPEFDISTLDASVMQEPWLNSNILQQPASDHTDAFTVLPQPEIATFSADLNFWDLATSSVDLADKSLVAPTVSHSCDCSKDSSNLWRFTNQTLFGSRPLDPEVLNLEDSLADDIPIRALVLGWPSVEAHLGGKLPPLWQKLRQNDERLYLKSCGKVERLAVLRLMHTLMLFHADPTQPRRAALPDWYLERPSQTLAHSYATNFLAWPGLRERFVFFEHRYCTSTFLKLFASNLRILWPYEFRDCYIRNTETGHYKSTLMFEQRIRDINAWTMTNEIFQHWPELYADIPAANQLNRSLGAVASSPMLNMAPKWNRRIQASNTHTTSESSTEDERRKLGKAARVNSKITI